MKKIIIAPFVLVLTLSSLFSATGAYAATTYDLISNQVYLNKNSMTQQQIQKFLESKGSKLATYKDQGPNETKKELASYLIWHAAQIWGINPQVILATLQKEQTLITNPNPPSWALNSAMGYRCPDSGGCDPVAAGFAKQVNGATYQFRYNYEVLKGNTSFKDIDGDTHLVGNYACNGPTVFYNKALRPGNTVTFKRNTTINGTKDKTVTIANEATASLLCYTPHVGPYSETGYSGSDNFVYWFKQWFGSTHYALKGAIGAKYTKLGGASSKLGEVQSNEIKISGGLYQKFEKGRIYWSSKTGAWSIRGGILSKYLELGAEKSKLGYPVSDEASTTGGVVQKFEKGNIYWSDATKALVTFGGIHKKYTSMNAEKGALGFPTSGEIKVAGGVYQSFTHGRIYWSSKTDAHSVVAPIYDIYHSNGGASGFLGFPLANSGISGDYNYQRFQGGMIYKKDSGEIRIVRGGIYKRFAALKYHNHKLQYPVTNEIKVTGGVYQEYVNGRIYWSSKTGAVEVLDHIEDYHTAAGGAAGRFGYPLSAQKSESGYTFQQFQGGTIYSKGDEGTWPVIGAIGSRYRALGAEKSFLKHPVSGEIKSNGGVYQKFRGGHIYWSSKTGAWSTHGAIHKKYVELGAEKSLLGFPVSGEIKVSGGVYQKFEKGYIYWSGKTGTWSVRGGILSRYLSLGAGRGRLGFPTSDETKISGGARQLFSGGTITWRPGGTTVSYK